MLNQRDTETDVTERSHIEVKVTEEEIEVTEDGNQRGHAMMKNQRGQKIVMQRRVRLSHAMRKRKLFAGDADCQDILRLGVASAQTTSVI